MKKLSLTIFSLFGLAFFPFSVNAGECAKHELDALAIKGSNEYLYQNESEHDAGFVFECGGGHCDGGTLIFMPKKHYFGNEPIDTNRVYVCREKGDTRWSEYSVTDFASCPIEKCASITNAIEIDDHYLIDQKSGTSGISTGSGQAMTLQTATDLCTCKKTDDSNGNDKNNHSGGNPTGGGKTSSSCTDRCRGMSGVQYTECVTCCKVSEDYADWNGRECVCADKTLDFNVLTQKCEAPSEEVTPLPEVVVTPECPDTQVTILNQWLIQYAGNSDVISRVQVLLDYCNGAVINITSFNQMFTELQNFIDGLATSAEQDASRRRIEESVSAINSRIGDLDVSVWRNAEGEFNTSRLLSDSIAGVVLGTAGGLITSHVVKKNNIASGFEDIKCAIGGQVVADWGDQFQVGIQ